MLFFAKKALYISKFLFLVLCCVLFVFPGLVSGQDTSSPPPEAPPEATPETTPEPPEEPPTQPVDGGYSQWFLNLFLGDPGEGSDPTFQETFNNTPTDQSDVQEDSEETPNEEYVVVDPGELAVNPLPTPTLNVRRYDKEVLVDPKADHSCEVLTHSVDLTEQTFAFRQISLEMFGGKSYNLEVGSLPEGIDVVFGESDIHLLHLDSPQEETTLEISRQFGARKGNFSIPIMFFERGMEDSAYICQLNIINR